MFEVFVYLAASVEAVHLRGGRVARGRIRWSDRREDFRTEVLGLMKAQTGQEHRDRPGRSQGRLRSSSGLLLVVTVPAAARGEDVECLPDVHARSARRDRPRSPGARVRVPPRPDVFSPRRRRPVPRRRGRQGHGDLLPRHRERQLRSSYGFWLGDAFRLRRFSRVTTTRPDRRSRRAVPGQSVKRLPASSGGRHRDHPISPLSELATCPATCSATACCSPVTSGWIGAFDHRHVFLDPNPDAAASFRRARGGSSSCRARPGRTTTPR